MRTRVTMPKLGESVIEGTVIRWLKREGEAIEEYEPLLEVSTDKVDSEIPAAATGVLLRILVAAGETVAVGTTIAEIGAPGDDGTRLKRQLCRSCASRPRWRACWLNTASTPPTFLALAAADVSPARTSRLGWRAAAPPGRPRRTCRANCDR